MAVFITAFEPGGTERQMTELVRRLDPRQFRVHVACFHRAGAWLPRVLERAASVVEFPIRGFGRPATAGQLLAFARWCRRERIAVVQTCDLYANIFGLPGAALAGVPVRIGSRRELNPDKSAGQIRLQRLAYRAATKVVANSPAARQVLTAEGVAPGSIAVIPNGVDPSWFDLPDHRRPIRTVITVANLRPEKSHDTLLEAAAALAPTHPDLRFQIVGDGPRRQQLEARAAALGLGGLGGLGGIVQFLGHRDDVPALLAAADLFVLPSRSEAFPNGAIEAMAAGLPVVACAVGGLVDLIDPGVTGLLVSPGDAAALAAAIARLAGHPAEAESLGRAARLAVRQRYSFDRMVGSFEALYRSGLGAAAPVRTPAEAAGI
ncbi:MAG: glycosyltransferase [Acidobacteriota bacterium]